MRFCAPLFTVLALALSALAAPARAGDAAELNILGFSADSKIFAFEEYGVQDGSGFPYANRFYIDTATDKFLPGTPIRIRIEDDQAKQSAARAEAARLGAAIVSDDVLAANRGFTAAFNAVTEESADPALFKAYPRAIFPPVDPLLTLRLEEIKDLPALQSCTDMGQPILGFRLLRLDAQNKPTVLNEDKSVPTSRNCPTGYRLGAIQTFYPSDGPPVFAVLVTVRGVGFEGPDYRWLAVTSPL